MLRLPILLQCNCCFPGSRHRRVPDAPCCRETETPAVLAQRAYATTWPSPAEHREKNGRSPRLLSLTWPALVRAQTATATIAYHCDGLAVFARVCCRDQATADVWWRENAGDVHDTSTNSCPTTENFDTASVGVRSGIDTASTLYLPSDCRSPAANLRCACRPPSSCFVHRRRRRFLLPGSVTNGGGPSRIRAQPWRRSRTFRRNAALRPAPV